MTRECCICLEARPAHNPKSSRPMCESCRGFFYRYLKLDPPARTAEAGILHRKTCALAAAVHGFNWREYAGKPSLPRVKPKKTKALKIDRLTGPRDDW